MDRIERDLKMKRTLSAVGAVGAGLALALTSAAPAHANDFSLTIKNASGNVIAKAWYDDLTDNLCVKSNVDGQMASVKIGPNDGGTFAGVNHAGFGKPASCTGNMSVAEDRYFWMILSYPGKSSKDGHFYT